MPFLSPDWRCPGDQWLKTNESGSMWENAKIYRLRMFETINENVVKRFVVYFLIIRDVRLCRQTLEDEMKSTPYVIQASCNQTERFRKLLDALRENLDKNEYDHIGSALLWQNHKKALDEMYIRIDEFDIEKIFGHPCHYPDKEQRIRLLTPNEFITLFQI
ncbi:unnamed protein product [Schistosoma curassoni]|uniref:Uncharacterized protein n=1 Tax=Schistosoma curassoni TaxID=6186 RepID=A0A183K4N6_9TREM|nr:unnamed protein product [Schistosoma curassoni]